MNDVRNYILERGGYAPELDPKASGEYNPKEDPDFWFVRNEKAIRTLRNAKNAADVFNNIVQVGTNVRIGVESAMKIYDSIKRWVQDRKRKKQYDSITKKSIAYAHAVLSGDKSQESKLAQDIRTDPLSAHRLFRVMYAAEIALAFLHMEASHETEPAIQRVLPRFMNYADIREVINARNNARELDGIKRQADEMIITYKRKYRLR